MERCKVDDFRIKTTKSFTHTITVDGSAPTFTDADYVYFIMKEHIDDTDAEAIITKTGTNGDDGEVTFVLCYRYRCRCQRILLRV